MGTELIPVFIRKGLIMPFRATYRSVCGHPFILVMVALLFLIYRYFPPIFAFLVSSSPVIICTFLFLGILLNSSEPNTSEHGKRRDRSRLPSGSKGKRLSSKSHTDGRKDRVEFDRRRDVGVSNLKKEALVLNASKKGVKKDVIILGASSSAHKYKREATDERGDKRVTHVHCNTKREVSEENLVQGVSKEGKVVRGNLDDSTSSASRNIDGSDRHTDSGSEGDGSSSPDASMEGIIPMLDELHPLLDVDPIQPAQVSSASETSSTGSSQSHKSDDDDSEEEAENQENEEDEEEEEETQEEKDDGTEVVLKWTADDEKNLRDVGTSELERNQRLEHLIAKRRARNYLRSETEKNFEKNLIDLDSNEPTSVVEELSHLLVMIPPRRNPFDLPFALEETAGLPPIPGSAPSVLLPRRNPFDLPCDNVSANNGVLQDGSVHRDSVAVQPKDMFFRRHESFAMGASFPVEHKQEKRESRFRPFFMTERMDGEETSYARFQSQLSGKSDSKLSTVPESELTSSVSNHSNQDSRKETPVQDMHQQCRELSLANHDSLSVEQESQSSEDGESIEIEQGHESIYTDGGQNAEFGASQVTGKEVENQHGARQRSPVSNAAKVEEVDEIYDESSSSSYSEGNGESIDMNIDEGLSSNLVRARDSSVGSRDSVQSVIAESELMRRDDEVIDEKQIEEPVYDSSPSAIEKSLSNIASLEEALLFLDKGSLKSSSSLASDMQVEISEIGSPSRLNDHHLFPGEESSSANDGLWVASPNLSFVDQNESKTNEVTEIREHDVIQVGISGINPDFVAPVVPQSVREDIMHSAISSPVETSVEKISVKDGGSSLNNAPSYLSRLALVDDLKSAPHIAQPLTDDSIPPPSPPSSFGIVESRVDILPPIPEEILEEFKHEEEHDVSEVFHGDHTVLKKSRAGEDSLVPEINGALISSETQTVNERAGERNSQKSNTSSDSSSKSSDSD